MLKRFFREQKGETNIVSILVLLIVIIVAYVLFGEYVKEFILGLF